MADISKINVNSTTYNLKDSRIPALPGTTTTYLRGDGTWVAPTVSTTASASDVEDKSSYLLITPASGGGGGSVNLQAKTGIVPATASQTITADSGYDGLSSVQINAMPSGSAATPATSITATPTLSLDSTTGKVTATVSASQSVTPTVSAGYVSSGTAGTVSVSGSDELQLETFPGTVIDADQYSNVVPAGRYLLGEVRVNPIMMHYQYAGYDYVASTSYTATDVTCTVEATGTYDVSWMGWRTSTSGTSGSQLYINGTAYSTARTTFTGSYGQSVVLTGVSLSAGDVLVVRARSRSTSYYMYVGNLIVQQTA